VTNPVVASNLPAPGASSTGGGEVVAPRPTPRLAITPVLAMAPFTVYVTLLLFVPIGAVVLLSLQDDQGNFTTANLALLFHGIYAQGFLNSMRLSAASALIPAVVGVFLAHAIATSRFETFRRLVASAAGVFANFGGINLAFIFLAAYSYTGIVVAWLRSAGIDLYAHGYQIYGFDGIVFVYCYFQIPLMVLIVTPALGAIRPAWREAVSGLGGSTWRFWRHVGIPVLLPSILSGTLLLFGSAFAAYATCQALTSGTVELWPIQIGNILDGNILAGQDHIAYAIGTGMLVVLFVTMSLYLLLQRRARRWLPS